MDIDMDKSHKKHLAEVRKKHKGARIEHAPTS